MIKKWICMMIVLCMVLTLSACSSASDEGDVSGAAQGQTTEGAAAADAYTPPSDFSGTLTLSSCWSFYNIESAIEKFEARYPNVTIIHTNYDNDYEKYQQNIDAQLMSGTAPDVIDCTNINYQKYMDSGLLVDLYPYVKSDTTFNQDDYYMSVVNGLSYQDKLPLFPITFNYELIGFNKTVSDSFTSEFMQLDTVNSFQLLDFFEKYGNGVYYIHSNMDAINMAIDAVNSFVNLQDQTCSFDSDKFIGLLERAAEGTHPDKTQGVISSNFFSRGSDELLSQEYLFKDIRPENYQYFFQDEYIFEQESSGKEGFFGHYIPLSSESGNVLFYGFEQYAVSESAENKDLAWEFIKFISTPEANEFRMTSAIPVNRQYCREALERDIKELWVRVYETEMPAEIYGEQVQSAVAQIEKYNEMPMESKLDYGSVIYEEILPFMEKTLTAQQAAGNIQNKMALLLME